MNDAIIFYYNKISHGVKVSFKNVSDEEYNLIMDEIENYICKRLYNKSLFLKFSKILFKIIIEYFQQLNLKKTRHFGEDVKNWNGLILIIWKLSNVIDVMKCGNMLLKVIYLQ